MQNLDPNKAKDHDKISIRLIKTCGQSICKPLELIFNQCINTGSFPLDLKKPNVFPLHKKGDKQFLKNYRTMSLLPNCGKMLDRLTRRLAFIYNLRNKRCFS